MVAVVVLPLHFFTLNEKSLYDGNGIDAYNEF